ncbi:hypothetical protein [Colwellia sp. TT2012]|uniref:hypothetical protein n=1 Tax=Colwellia sp. TT2012 TaxID=1720342 RepID=UPI00070ED699|nr:hypothetical protein [Colwellia sp. TT2012]
MKTELLKYKHYLLVLLALLVANYLLEPLTELQSEQQQTLNMLQKKQDKTNALITNGDDFLKKNEELALYLANSHDYLFTQKSEAEFKLIAQTQIEQLLQTSGCAITRIGFKGKQQILPKVQKWHMEVRYTGDANCLIKTTRALETAKPYINIEEYNYRADAFDKRAQAEFTAILKVSVWYKAHVNNTNSVKG